MSVWRDPRGSRHPGPYARELLPVGPLLAKHYTQRQNWALRMAARSRMERENLLQISRCRDLLNPVLPAGKKLWTDITDDYIAIGRKRLTKYVPADIGGMPANRLDEARKEAAKHLLARMGKIVQRRHDIVHNVDRPRSAPRSLPHGQARAMVRDVKDFVRVLDDHVEQYRVW